MLLLTTAQDLSGDPFHLNSRKLKILKGGKKGDKKGGKKGQELLYKQDLN